jgi:hypothetical protein
MEDDAVRVDIFRAPADAALFHDKGENVADGSQAMSQEKK